MLRSTLPLAFLLLFGTVVFAQPTSPALNELPALQSASEIDPKAQALGEPWIVDINSREEVRQFYRSIYNASNQVDSGWNGNTASGNAGTTTDAFKSAVIDRINFYRALAGVPAVIKINSTFSAKAQQAALIMSANGGLSHTPADEAGWVHVTADGHEAAGKSNIGIGSRGPNTIDGYMRDHGAGNESVGHRRWLFHGPTQEMGTGDVEAQGSFQAANALWVQDAQVFSPRPASREEFVAWPPKGKIPAPLVWARWSFSYPGADFSGSTVTMTRDGSPISADLNAITGGSALDPIIVWRYDGKSGNDLTPHLTPSSDTNYEVTINNVNLGGSSRSFTYTVTVFDPNTPGTDFVESTVAGPTNAGTGGPTEFTATIPTFGSGFYWRELTLSPLSVIFGAEGSLQGLVDGTNASYSARATNSTASGNGVYHLTHPEPGVETLTLPDRYKIATNGPASLAFASRIGFASADQVATVELSTNGGSSWSAVYSQAGTSNGSAPTESSFQNRSIDLTSFAGQTLNVRFVFTFSSGTFFNSASTNSGWLIDDINLDGAQVAVVLSTSGHVSGTTFDYTASSTGSKGLQVRGAFFDNYAMDWGSVYSVTADSGNGSGGGGGDASRIVNMSVRSVSGTGADALSVGMVVGGAGAKNLVIRVVGPTLGAFGVPGVVTDPQLQLLRSENGSNVAVIDNDNWDGGPTLTNLFSTLGAFPLSSNLDAAISTLLTTAVYIAVADTKGSTGVVLVEAYDTEAVTSGTARLVNVSARSQVGTGGDVLVAGFVIAGTGTKTLLIRGVGASLGDFGVPGVLQNPQLIVHKDSGATVIASNDNWNNNASIASTAQTLGAFPLSSTADAALLVTLAPGVYTATVSGVNDTTGIALVEVYEVP